MIVKNVISVIIPAHNAEMSLAQAVDSALEQAMDTQIIVINDGSTDGTAAVARSYGDRIIYLEQDNLGQGAARNAGLAVANGEFVAFLDADDYWRPGFLERCIEFLGRYTEAVAVSTGLIVRSADGDEQIHPAASLSPSESKEGRILPDFFRFWAEQDHVRTGAVLIRKSVIDRAGVQRADLRISQDLEYWGYLATFGAWGFIPEPLWVGNSRAVAASGWLARYRARRRLCPTVESWEERIVPRLQHDHWASFRLVRGRVAANFAHSKILGGAPVEAMEIVRKYGDEMPANRLTKLLKAGVLGGSTTWKVACWVVQAREISKAGVMRVRARRSI